MKFIRASHAQVVVIALSSSVSESLSKAPAGVFAYLSKPPNTSEIVSTIAKARAKP